MIYREDVIHRVGLRKFVKRHIAKAYYSIEGWVAKPDHTDSVVVIVSNAFAIFVIVSGKVASPVNKSKTA